MRPWLIVAFLLAPLLVFGQAPIITPLNPTLYKSQAQTFSCSGNCGTPTTGWTVTGAGSINSGTGGYTAPASVTAKQSIAGFQLGPNNIIFNQDISALTGAALSGTSFNFNILPSFPINYCNNSSPTDSMVFFYTSGHNGTFCAPSQNAGLSGRIESGWYKARNLQPGVTPNSEDHHYIKCNYVTGICEDQYQYYVVGNATNEGCPTCNSQSGVKYNVNSYALPDASTDAAGLYLTMLMLRRQEFDQACAAGAGTGAITHALRLTLGSAAIGPTFIWPAVTGMGIGTNPYGERIRLKSSFSEVGYSACAKVILHELKNYGMFLADVGFNGQANIEHAAWSEADLGYFAEVNGIASTNFESVDESAKMLSSSSLESTDNRETVCYAATTGTTCTDVVLLGVTVGMLQDSVNIMAGAPNYQFLAQAKGASNTSLTWALSGGAPGSIDSNGLYTPPATLVTEAAVTVTATSVSDNTVSATSVLYVWPQVSDYILPSWSTGNDFTDSGGKVWRSGAGIGIDNHPKQIGCCSDQSSNYTGSPTDKQLFNHAFFGSLNNLEDYHFYEFVPAGTYTVKFNTIAIDAPGANVSNVNFVAQGSTLLSNVDPAAAGVGQYGPYTHSFNLTVACDNLLTFDEQSYNPGGDESVSSLSIIQNTNTQGSCGGGGGGSNTGSMSGASKLGGTSILK